MKPQSEPVAIIGIGCRFPKADGPDALWRCLVDGVDAIGEIPRAVSRSTGCTIRAPPFRDA